MGELIPNVWCASVIEIPQIALIVCGTVPISGVRAVDTGASADLFLSVSSHIAVCINLSLQARKFSDLVIYPGYISDDHRRTRQHAKHCMGRFWLHVRCP